MELTAADIEEHRLMLSGRARCLRYLFNWPASVEVEDVVSMAIMKAWGRRQEFRGDRTLRGQVASWLLLILNSEIVDTLRRTGAEKRGMGQTRSFEDFIAESEVAIEKFLVADISTPSSKLQAAELLQAAYAAIELLPNRQRVCLLARFIGGWKIQEIAADLNRSLESNAEPVTEKAVTSAIERALRKLREVLQHMN